MKILHVLHGLTVGGAEVDLLRKSRVLRERFGADLTIACLLRRGELADEAEAAGIEVLGPYLQHRYDVGAARRLRTLLRRGWDLVHSHLFAANFVVGATRATGGGTSPWIAAEHALAERWGRVARTITNDVARRADLLQFPTEFARATYGYPAGRTAVVPNAIPPPEARRTRAEMRDELGLRPDEFTFGTVSRLQPIKQLDILVRAAAEAEISLCLTGDGPERHSLEGLARDLGAQERIRFLGSRADVPDLLGAWDAFALHSRSESFGMAVAEALLAGLPVVATNVGAIREITDDGAFARLVPVGDVASLATALRALQENPAPDRERVRRGAAAMSARFSPYVVAERQWQIYEAVTGGNA